MSQATAKAEAARILDAAPSPVAPAALTDLGNGERFARRNADRFLHVYEQRRWLQYNGNRWATDTTGAHKRAAKATARTILAEASTLDGDRGEQTAKWALQSQAEPRLRAMVEVASSEPGIATSADQLDADPWLLSCANGTLNLRTATLHQPAPADLITRGTQIAYRDDAECPRWLRFLSEVFDGDAELIAFVHKFVGCCLTGDTREHVLAVLHGSGCNGKSTFIAVLQRLLGDLASAAAFDTFMRHRDSGGPRNDLARLQGARLVTAAESGEGRRLDEATVKEITGGDKITARFLYGEHFEFVPHFKVVLVTNHRPRVDGEDDAMWRRLRLVPFEVSFEGREDRQLGAALEQEMSGILRWAVDGCQTWQRDGLGEAGAVTRATAEYRQDEDVLGAFLAECCHMHGETTTVGFRQAYENYCTDAGEKPLTPAVLGRRLTKRRVHREQRPDGDRARIYRGVSLR